MSKVVEYIRETAKTYEKKSPGWSHVRFMTDNDILRLVGPHYATKPAAQSFYREYIKSGAYQAYEVK